MNNPAKKAERERNLNYMIVLKNPPQSRNPFVHLDDYVEAFVTDFRRFNTTPAARVEAYVKNFRRFNTTGSPDEYRKLEVLKIYGLAKLLGGGHWEALKFIGFITVSSLPYAHTDPKRFEMYYKTILNVDSLIVHSSRSYGEVKEEDVPAFRLADTVIRRCLWGNNSCGVVRKMQAEWTEPILENLPFSVSDRVGKTVCRQLDLELSAAPFLGNAFCSVNNLYHIGGGCHLPKFFFAEA
jgi:hypothetical protein